MAKGSCLTKQDAFLILFVALHDVVSRMQSVIEEIEDKAGRILDCCKGDGEERVVWIDGDWSYLFPEIDKLDDSMESTLLKSLNLKAFDEVYEAIRYIEAELPEKGGRGGSGMIISEARDHLENAKEDLEDYCYQQAVKVFGHWGGYWFRIATMDNEESDLHDGVFNNLDYDAPDDDILRAITSSEIDETEREWTDALEDRNRWIYDQVMAGVKFSSIIRDLKTKPLKWSRVSTPQGIKKIAKNYAERNGLPSPEPRSPGRPAAS